MNMQNLMNLCKEANKLALNAQEGNVQSQMVRVAALLLAAALNEQYDWGIEFSHVSLTVLPKPRSVQ